MKVLMIIVIVFVVFILLVWFFFLVFFILIIWIFIIVNMIVYMMIISDKGMKKFMVIIKWKQFFFGYLVSFKLVIIVEYIQINVMKINVFFGVSIFGYLKGVMIVSI